MQELDIRVMSGEDTNVTKELLDYIGLTGPIQEAWARIPSYKVFGRLESTDRFPKYMWVIRYTHTDARFGENSKKAGFALQDRCKTQKDVFGFAYSRDRAAICIWLLLGNQPKPRR